MPTHQSLSRVSDDELLQPMVKTHPERFGEAYWKFVTRTWRRISRRARR
jgi:hypothetical protein